MLTEPSFSMRDLYFTLSAPYASSKEKKEITIWDAIHFTLGTSSDASIADRIQKMTLLKDTYVSKQSNAILKNISFHFFSNQISSCLSDFLQEVKAQGLTLEVAQKVYLLAQDLKRHVSNRSILWNALTKVDRIFLHQLSLVSEDLQILKEPIYYQWLGDGDSARAKQEGVTVTDFGDGRLFQVDPPSSLKTGEYSEFPLVRYSDLSLVKASPEKRHFSRTHLITPMNQLNRAAIGRLAEIFDVYALEEKMEKEKENAILYHNQLNDLFSCYGSALCSVLDAPVRLPLGIGRQGEWVIWNHKTEEWKGQSLSPSMVNDLHRLLQVERLWKINILVDPITAFIFSQFAIYDDHLFVDEILPLPTFLTSDIQTRHHRFIHNLERDHRISDHLAIDLQGPLDKLREAASEEEEKETNIVHWLQMLVNRKSLSLQDLMALDAQALLIVHLMRLIDEKVSVQFPLASPLFYDTASQMLAHLVATDSGPYYRVENKGERFTNSILNSKKELRRLMLLFAIEKFEKQASTEECMQTIMQTVDEKCHEVAVELARRFSHNWPQQESVEEHFILLFGNELLEELDQVLQQPYDPQKHLYAQLALLREAAAHPETDKQVINCTLQSVLHDAMVQKYSQAFLADMRLVIESTNLAQDDN